MDLYAQHILDHFHHPHGKDAVAKPDIEHRELNPSCGDEVTVKLKIGTTVEIGWDGQGCAISQAAMSMLAEEYSGKLLNELEALTPKGVLDMLGVPVGARRMKCAMLGLYTIKNALRLHGGAQKQEWNDVIA